MDSQYLIEDGDNEIAGFQKLDESDTCQNIWCSQCALDPSEKPPYVISESTLQIPHTNEVSGSIDAIIYRVRGNKYNPSGSQFDLSHLSCDECGQTIQPK